MDEEPAQLLKLVTDGLAGTIDRPGLPQAAKAMAEHYQGFGSMSDRAAVGLDDADRRSADVIRTAAPSGSRSESGIAPKPGPQEPFLKIFPELGGVNPGFKSGQWGFRYNCQSCAVAVDQRLSRKYVMAVRRPKPPAPDWHWPDHVMKSVGVRDRPRAVSGFPEIERTLLSAGPEARGIIYGVRRDENGKFLAAHTFNVVNRRRRIFYVDGQLGDWANTDGYAELQLLRTN
ncbi:toxin glutamine deamidase domain-containing protein [Nocardia sp. NBC_01327]|uniref:toxin glutamine deamidase domain-containing protein n=1 Tax=Nocardia sp. NBC_01327 TaxID=2903593 RepID=UPI002E0DD66E|nr:toxin glutamine deamidase domain-containing protein [Nocardia sp. NBC_01327]